jgi:hypothetical protein
MKQGNLCHLDNNKNSINTITQRVIRREKVYTYIQIEYN